MASRKGQVKINFYIRTETYEKLKQAGELNDKSLSDIMRMLIDAYLSRYVFK